MRRRFTLRHGTATCKKHSHYFVFAADILENLSAYSPYLTRFKSSTVASIGDGLVLLEIADMVSGICQALPWLCLAFFAKPTDEPRNSIV